MDQDTLARRLADVDLFKGFSKGQLKRLAQAGSEVPQPDGKEIVAEGGRPLGFHLILSGKATVSVHGQVRRELAAGDHFGEISLLDGLPRSASVTGSDGLVTFSLLSWHFLPLLDAHPEMNRPLILELCRRLREAEGEA